MGLPENRQVIDDEYSFVFEVSAHQMFHSCGEKTWLKINNFLLGIVTGSAN